MIARADGELMLTAVKRTLAALELSTTDQAAMRLAEKYAEVIDSARDPAWAMRWIGPNLLNVLESLGATPAARGKTKNGTSPNDGISRLTVLRASRR